jgi:hypothetical protein
MQCDTREEDHQPYPSSGILAENLNLPLKSLRHRIGNRIQVTYTYVISSVRHRDNRFIQTGSGPNFQGGFITLCTCKHHMRSARDAEDWPRLLGSWLLRRPCWRWEKRSRTFDGHSPRI